MRIYLAALFAASLLTSCATVPDNAEIASANYGRDMTAAECASVAEKLIASTLKDPFSAQFQHNPECVKSFAPRVPLMGFQIQYGWQQTGRVNAKNSYGGYVGFREYFVLMRDGIPVRWCIFDASGACVPSGI